MIGRRACAVLLAFAAASATAATAPGLILDVRAGASGDQGITDARVARIAALFVPADAAATPLVPAGAFRAELRGVLVMTARQRTTFALRGRGRGSIQVGATSAEGDLVGESVGGFTLDARLDKGETPIVVRYESPAEGDASVQLWWRAEGFAWEPVPPSVLRHDAEDARLARGRAVRDGRVLFARARCHACHAGELVDGMPELGDPAPDLMFAGSRFDQGWLAAWLRDPRAVRADATMPRLLARGAEGEGQARDIAAYLETWRWHEPAAESARESSSADVRRGGELYAEFGCAACHGEPSDARAVAPTIAALVAKLEPQALVATLAHPGAHNPATRMPDFGLVPREAEALAAYLGAAAPPPSAAIPPGDPERGRALVEQLGCARCHTGVPPSEPPAAPPALAEIFASPWSERGCVAGSDPALPDFAFDAAERASLEALRQAGIAVLERDSTIEVAERAVATLDCRACHRLGGVGDRLAERVVPAADPAHASGVDQRRPELDLAGEKLDHQWLTEFLSGREERPRPWIKARMPAVAFHADRIATGLAHAHGLSVAREQVALDPAQAALGAALAAMEGGGFGCRTCHALGPQQPAIVAFEQAGIDLSLSGRRLRRGYFERWLRAPTRLDAATKMPQYFRADGTSLATSLAGGNADAQIAALWHYIQSLKQP